MMSSSKWYGLLLLVLPAAAMADAVEIVTHGSGQMRPDNGILQAFGMQLVPDDVPQPYMLTIAAVVAPDAGVFTSYAGGRSFTQAAAQVEVAFQYGTQRFRYAGPGDVILDAGNVPQSGDYYYQRVSFPLALPSTYYDTRITAGNFAPSPGADTYPLLAPPALGGPNGLPVTHGESAISAEFTYEDDAWYSYIGARAQDMTVMVTSPVPEPAGAPMLAAGLLAIGALAARLRRERLADRHPESGYARRARPRHFNPLRPG